jgi:hypothetical protein
MRCDPAVDAIRQALAGMQPMLNQYPLGFGQWLQALAYALSKPREIAVVGDPDSTHTQALLHVVRDGYRPFQVVALVAPDGPAATRARLGRWVRRSVRVRRASPGARPVRSDRLCLPGTRYTAGGTAGTIGIRPKFIAKSLPKSNVTPTFSRGHLCCRTRSKGVSGCQSEVEAHR